MVILLILTLTVQICVPDLAGALAYLNFRQRSANAPRGVIKKAMPISQNREGGFIAFSVLEKDKIWAIGHEGEMSDAASQVGVALRSTDEGFSWERKLSDPKTHFFDIYFLNKQVGWICGSDGVILKSTDGGENWIKQRTPTKFTLSHIHFSDLQTGWAIGFNGEVLSTNDGGENWQTHKLQGRGRDDRRFNGNLNSVSFSTKLNGWVVGNKGQAFHSTDGGVNWEQRGPELIHSLRGRMNDEVNFKDVIFFNSTVGYLIAVVSPRNRKTSAHSQLMLLKTENGGKRWRVLQVFSNREIVRAHFMNESEMWIVVDLGRKLLHTQDGGKSWKEIAVPADVDAPEFLFLDSKTAWALSFLYGISGTNLHTTDGGKTWMKQRLQYILQPNK